MNPYDHLCIKSDVCDMAVCDGVNVCKHAVQDTKESTNSSHNTAMREIALCLRELCRQEVLDNYQVRGELIGRLDAVLAQLPQ